MEARLIDDIAKHCSGKVVQAGTQPLAYGVSTDSREVGRGDLFFALEGDRFDGHAFVSEVCDKGAAGVVIEEGRWARGVRAHGEAGCIVVDSPRRALGRFAMAYRNEFQLPVIVVGGSNGKTSSKELIAAVLSERFETLRSKASFNNDIGVPLTLFGLETRHGIGVLEVGSNHPGELEPLVRMAQPQAGVITSIGREHLEFFGDLDGVIQEESWVGRLLPRDGTLYLNGDSPGAELLAEQTAARVVRVGFERGNDWRVERVRIGEGHTDFEVSGTNRDLSGDYRIRFVGRHQACNAAFAIAIAADQGFSREEIQRGLLACVGPKMRLQVWSGSGIILLDDSYNANAESMKAALDTLAAYPAGGRRIAVLGDMAELGESSEDAHREIGEYAAGHVQTLISIGAWGAVLADRARRAGLQDVHHLAEAGGAADLLRGRLSSGDVVLVKGSRAARLERVCDQIRRDWEMSAKGE